MYTSRKARLKFEEDNLQGRTKRMEGKRKEEGQKKLNFKIFEFGLIIRTLENS